MSRKPEPSFELKKIIWDVAATVGIGNIQAIVRQLDYDLEKRRKSADFFEDAPDQRTIKRIIEKDINTLSLEVVISKLPPHVWKLRNDYRDIKKLTTQKTEPPKQEFKDIQAVQVAIHDREIFEKSDKILNEDGFERLFECLKLNSFYDSQLTGILCFQEYFKSESHKYVDWHLDYICLRLCRSLFNLSEFIQVNSFGYFYVAQGYDKSSESKSPHWYRFLKTLLDNAPVQYADNTLQDKLYFVLDETSDHQIMMPEIPDIFIPERNLKWQREFDELTTNTRIEYREYRAAIRDTLFL